MECKDVEAKLIDLALGTLPEGLEMEVRSHLLLCEVCEQEYEKFKLVEQGIESLPDIQPSPSLKNSIMDQFREEKSHTYSEKLRIITKETSTAFYFAKWVVLQLFRPAVAAVIVLAALGTAFYMGVFQAGNDDEDVAKVLPPRIEKVAPAGGPRVSEHELVAQAEVDRMMKDMDNLDIPEQEWRHSEFEEKFGIKEIQVRDKKSAFAAVVEKTGSEAVPPVDPAEEKPGLKMPEIAQTFEHRFERRDAWYASIYAEDVRHLVDGGLKWLSIHQSSDGAWGKPESRIFVTALSGMCLLADMDAIDLMGYRRNLDLAAEYVLKQATTEGFFGGKEANGRRAHLTALNFLVEYAALTGRNDLRPVIARGLKYTHSLGNLKGWESSESKFKADACVVGWYIQLLESARLAGYSIERIYRDRARAWIKQATYGGKEGVPRTAAFQEDDNTKYAVALMGRFFMKEDLNKKNIRSTARKLIGYLVANTSDSESHDINPYFLYFTGLGLYQDHGKEWSIYKRELRTYLAGNSAKAIYFGKDQGSFWPAKGRRYAANGDAFYTAISILSLQTYYRYRLINK